MDDEDDSLLGLTRDPCRSGIEEDDIDHEEFSLLGWLLGYPSLRWYVISRTALVIIVTLLGFWQLIVTVADHQRGQQGYGQGYDEACRASAPDAVGCRLPPREAD